MTSAEFNFSHVLRISINDTLLHDNIHYSNNYKIKSKSVYEKVFSTPVDSNQVTYSSVALLAYFALNGIQKHLLLFSRHCVILVRELIFYKYKLFEHALYNSCLFRTTSYVNSKTCYTKQALRDTFKISEGRYRWICKCTGEFMRVFVLYTVRQ